MQPESVLTPGFRMSFAAVTGLVAAYEVRQGLRERRAPRERGWAVLAGRPLVYMGGVALTTVIAAAATAPFAAYHFNHAAPFALAGNLLGIPLIAFVIMPLAVLSMLAMGFGLESIPLAVMGVGIDWLLAAAAMVAAWPGATQIVPAMQGFALLTIVFGGLWLALWQRPWRLAGLAMIAAGIAFAGLMRGPDLLVDARVRTLALRDETGHLQLLVRGRSTYAAESWLERDGDSRGVDQIEDARFICDPHACVAPLAGEGHVALVTHPAALAEECRNARIVIVAFERHAPCRGPALVVDRQTLEQDGSLAVWLTGKRLYAEHAAPRSSRRPWRRRGVVKDPPAASVLEDTRRDRSQPPGRAI